MGVIDEIFSIIRKGPQVASQIDQAKLNTKTIAGGARDATFQFPVLVSNTIDIDMASTMFNIHSSGSLLTRLLTLRQIEISFSISRSFIRMFLWKQL